MQDAPVDLLDHRRRLVILAIAVGLAIATTVLGMTWIGSVARAPSSDPMSQASVGLMAIGMFVVTFVLFGKVCAAVDRRYVRRS